MTRLIVLAAVTAATAGLALGGLLGGAAPSADAARRPCSSYPAPGTTAPASATVPRAVSARYAILRRRRRAADRLAPGLISRSLTASGVITSAIRLLGETASGGRVYLIPALHVLAFPIAPARCLSAAERPLERELLPELRRQYALPALCVELVRAGVGSPSCGPAAATTEALLYTSGTPGFGLVPDGVRAVTVSYVTAPPRTIAVHENFFSIIAPRQPVAPCGLQWLDGTGSVIASIGGCSFIALERRPLAEYRAYVAGKLAALQSQVSALIAAISGGDVAQARAAWLSAHLTWLEIGQDDGAYGAFGELGRAIDGTAAGLPGATDSPDFTGFHKVELDLWMTGDLAAAAADAATLQSRLAALTAGAVDADLPATKTGIANWVLRPHEILEDAERDTLTAQDDYGSGTDLASLTADIAATRELLNLLAPVIAPVAPRLVGRAENELTALSAAVQATRAGGVWVPVQSLPPDQREQIDADLGAALETLAPIPDLITSTGNHAAS